MGTLKRKRQLREFVEQHECGHENDLFDSTPFRQQKSRKVGTVRLHGVAGAGRICNSLIPYKMFDTQ